MRARFFIFGLIQLFSVAALAAQDDLKVLLRDPQLLFRGSEPERSKFLSAVNGNVAAGFYLLSDQHHWYQFRGSTDIALASFGNWGVFRAGLNLEVVGANQPTFPFLLAQTHYEIFAALEYRLGGGVLYGGYRHRCRHRADAYIGRILIRTGPEVGYNRTFDLRSTHLIWNSWLDAYVLSQNAAGIFPRGMIGSALQAEWKKGEVFTFFASLGLSATLTTVGPSIHQFLTSEFNEPKVSLSPGAAVGLRIKGGAGELALYVNYVRNIDSGFTSQVLDVNAVTAMAELLL